MMDRLDAAQITIDRLRTERDAWQDEYDKVFVQRDELLRQKALMQDELESYEEQMITMRATLKANHLNYDNTQDLKLTPPDKK
jgi:predicted  nucleic acid-binding Zn-ribbon protein